MKTNSETRFECFSRLMADTESVAFSVDSSMSGLTRPMNEARFSVRCRIEVLHSPQMFLIESTGKLITCESQKGRGQTRDKESVVGKSRRSLFVV